ncbi:capsular polysaccharide synthesis protein [Mangrovimonas aestuarii]|uniref:capsular polysaccharide synthesis protein n=1 Tax=Mangrovimonas aestuarii TaxID=3018443 RepID=UPI002379ECFF|nr:capsular polysaccharide synthesis protein [Mangrovimonas aestuarii]
MNFSRMGHFETLPKIIWTYWHQGFENAPWVVQRCIEQLKLLHSDWEIHLLDAKNIHEYAKPLPIREEVVDNMLLQHRSDLLRTQLLITYGGVWIDPTVYCKVPLSDWLYNHMASGLFLYKNPGRDRIISNWFIASKSNNILLKQLYKKLCDYWNENNFRNISDKKPSKFEKNIYRIVNRRPAWTRIWFTRLMLKVIKFRPYMVYHYAFYELIKTDKVCNEIWSNTNSLPASKPHKLQRLGLLSPMNEEAKKWIEGKDPELFKLTWRLKEEAAFSGSTIEYLFNHSQA